YYGGNVLYHNNGNGTFADVTAKAGVRGHGWGMGCAFGDYDNDGRLDLYVANYLDVDINHLGEPGSAPNCTYRGIATFCGPRGLPGGRDILFHNNGNGTFADVTEKAGIDADKFYGLGVVWGDYDKDGRPDIYVANDSTPSSLYHNNGDGTFTDLGVQAGVAYSDEGQEQAGMGTDFGDYDNDGWKDIILANGQVFPQIDRYQTGITYAERNLLFHNRGGAEGLKFDEVGLDSGPGFAVKKVSRGLATADYDNDGDLEILVTN